jgi:hypothetical protein
MTPDTFEQTLRTFLRREPFEPFFIELIDGRQLLIDLPHTVSMGGGGACFMSPEYDFYSFSSEEVREIRSTVRETAS